MTAKREATPYWQKLQDPRWQRKRLEIMERDQFSCSDCGDANATLHVHHRYYEKGLEPWEYGNDTLTTLCARCHTNTEEVRVQILRAFGRQWGAGEFGDYQILGYLEGLLLLSPHGLTMGPVKILAPSHLLGICHAWGVEYGSVNGLVESTGSVTVDMLAQAYWQERQVCS